MLLTAFLSLLVIRHLTQFIDGLQREDRIKLVVFPIRVRAVHITVLWFAIMIGAALKLWLRPPPIDHIFITGWGLLLAGIALGMLAYMRLRPFFSQEPVIFKGAGLVRDGIYSIVRHPYRLGLILEMLGAILVSRTWYSLLLWLGAIVGLLYRTRQEDQMLRQYHGAAAANYQTTVPAWNVAAGLIRLRKGNKGD